MNVPSKSEPPSPDSPCFHAASLISLLGSYGPAPSRHVSETGVAVSPEAEAAGTCYLHVAVAGRLAGRPHPPLPRLALSLWILILFFLLLWILELHFRPFTAQVHVIVTFPLYLQNFALQVPATAAAESHVPCRYCGCATPGTPSLTPPASLPRSHANCLSTGLPACTRLCGVALFAP